MVGIFLVAAIVTAIAVVPALILRIRPGKDEPADAGSEERDYAEIAF